MNLNEITQGDCIEGMKQLPDACVDCCVTSPPYFGLRDYGTAKWEGGSESCDHKKQNAEIGHIAHSTLGGGQGNECGTGRRI